ncbi:DUF7093 family protein [Natronorubrum tibetense]|uniref:Uncharacterized protein n=1 Tax=Natronorubrum tibetense GA33 TaxID=1114856 RepID=L9VXT4_9EURY|nr:hypothetical protein [Natronorubrum tibetense]ELY41842.1 hypothetical protein C496_08606 [Natronorubrum tibetense GA33]
MVLRCSLLGHDYGDTDVEREREERGSEVVVTVQEYEECERCGDRNVISENTEVTSLSAETAADALPDEYDLESDSTAPTDGEAVETPPDATAEAGTEVEFSEGDDDAALIDADDGDADPAAPAAGAPETEPAAGSDEAEDEFDVPTDENGDPVTDDGEILEDDEPPADRDREHGEWPDSEDVGPPVGAANEPTEWPDSDDAEADDADAVAPAETDDDAELVDADTEVTDDAMILEDDTDATSDGAESPAAADARSVTTTEPNPSDAQGADEATAQADTSGNSGSGIERAATAPTPGQSGGTARDDIPSEFYCPRCEYVAGSDRSSLRAGDICPECRKGYLGEREQ